MKTFDSEAGTELLERGKRGASGESRDLFSSRPAPSARARTMRTAPEITAARVLCNQLKRKRVSAEKKRIIHLICLNLVAILKRKSQQA